MHSRKILHKLLLSFSFLTASSNLFAQAEVGTQIEIPANAKVIKVVKVKTQEAVPVGSEIKSEKILKSKDVTYTVTQKETVAGGPKMVTVDKEIEIDMAPNADGIANLTIDEKDKTIMHVNYWLNPRNTVPGGRKIAAIKRTSDDQGIYTDGTPVYTTLSKETIYYLSKVDPNNNDLIGTTWYKSTSLKIIVYKEDGITIDYELVNRYDRDADYRIKLQNRQYISYRKQSLEYGPIIIPIKYRFERNRGTIKAKDEFQSDLNIGVYGGYRLSKYRVRYEGDNFKELSAVSISIGGFLNVGTTSIDSVSTTLGDEPFKKDEKASIGTFSPGLGIILSVHNLQLGLFGGMDFGFGHNAKQWNYNNRPWIGFGLGYNVSGLWKK
jgi:hypothetical protein